MEVSSTKVETLKNILLKAGISLAVTVAGYIFVSIATRKESDLQSSLSDFQVGDEEAIKERDLEVKKISGIRSRMEELQQKVINLEERFLQYNDLKEKEGMLMERQNRVLTEIGSIEFLEMEVLGLEAENQRFENLLDYHDALEVIELSRTENQMLQGNVNKLWDEINTHSSLMKEKSLQIKAKQSEISRNHEDMGRMMNTIQGMEEETREMRMNIDKLQGEKEELLDKLDEMVMIDGEVVSIEEYTKVVNELEEIRKVRAAETKEWCPACLRHELMRTNQHQTDEEIERKHEEERHYTGTGEPSGFGSDNELETASWGHEDDPCFHFSARGRHHSRIRRLIEKFEKWIDGSKKLKEK